MLHHPEIAGRTCDVCERFVWNAKGGLVYHPKTGTPIERKEYGPACVPDCSDCPKCEGEDVRSPVVGRGAELSRKNSKTLEVYYQTRVCPLSHADSLLRSNLGIIQSIFEKHDRQEGSNSRLLLAAVLGLRR